MNLPSSETNNHAKSQNKSALSTYTDGLMVRRWRGDLGKRREILLGEVQTVEQLIKQRINDANKENIKLVLEEIDTFQDFRYFYGDGDAQSAIEERTQQIIALNWDKLETFISVNELQNSIAVIKMFLNLAKGGRLVDLPKIEDLLLRQLPLIETLFQDTDLFHQCKGLIDFALDVSGQQVTDQLLQIAKKVLINQNEAIKSSLLTDLLLNENEKHRKFGEEVVTELIALRFTVDGNLFISLWRENIGKKPQEMSECVISNFVTMQKLESAAPHSVHTLFQEFGIVNFGRYPVKVLKAQYEERAEKEKPYGILLFPLDDWNGTFFYNNELLADFFDQLEGKFGLKVIEVNGRYQAARKLISTVHTYGKISFGIIGGHGSEESIQFGKFQKEGMPLGDGSLYSHNIFEYDGENGSYDVSPKKTAPKVLKYFVDNPELILASCSTAGDEESIAQKISQLGSRVTGPVKDAHVSNLKVEFRGGKPHLTVFYKNKEGEPVRARSFENGMDVTV